MKKSLFVILLSILLLVSCSNEKNILKIGISQQPTHLDVQKDSTQAIRMITGSNIYEKLVTVNKNGVAVLELAESYFVSVDAKIITFKLRDNVIFHNGKKMKAEDVVASMNRWIESYHVAKHIVGNSRFSEVDEYTVEIRSDKSIYSLVDIIANSPHIAAIMPKEVAENVDENGIVKEYIGTGVYKFNEWVEDEYIELTRFKKYKPSGGEKVYGLAGKKLGKIETIRYYFESNQEKRTQALENGEYHFINAINNDDIERLEKITGLELSSKKEVGSLVAVFNKRSGTAADIDVRKAINIGIDCAKIMEAGYGKNGYVLHPNYMETDSKTWIVEGLDKYYNQNDKEMAKKILSDSSYDGKPIRILVANLSNLERAAYALQSELSLIGIESVVNVVDWVTYMELREDENEYEIYISAFLSVPVPTQEHVLCSHYAGWTSDPHIVELIDKFNRSLTKADQQVAWAELQTYCYEYLPALNVGHYQETYLWRNEIQDVHTDFGYYFWNTTFTK